MVMIECVTSMSLALISEVYCNNPNTHQTISSSEILSQVIKVRIACIKYDSNSDIKSMWPIVCISNSRQFCPMDWRRICLIQLAIANHKNFISSFRIGVKMQKLKEFKVTILLLFKWSDRHFQSSSLCNVDLCLYYEHIVQSHCNVLLLGVMGSF